jgi:hypothetical protein
MYETELQKEVSTAILTGKVGSLTVGITDNERLVEVDIGEKTAVYTAYEARQLAEEMRKHTKQDEAENRAVVEYLGTLADVVDGKKTADEVRDE